jgi:hypothetical protein
MAAFFVVLKGRISAAIFSVPESREKYFHLFPQAFTALHN